MGLAGASGCYSLSRTRFVPGDFVGGGGDGAQTNRDETGTSTHKSPSEPRKGPKGKTRLKHGDVSKSPA